MRHPRPFIAMATGILGGPGKGLVQFFRHGGLDGCAPLVIDYHRGFETGETEFAAAVRSVGVPMAKLVQKTTFDIRLVDQALPLLREYRINILQSHGYKSHVLCWLLRRKTGLPWIAFVHGWTRENLRVRVYNGIEQVMLLAADEVVAVSESLRQRLLPSVRTRCVVIPNALAPEELGECEDRSSIRSRLGFPDDAVVVGLVGRLSPEKGHSVFLRALAAARAKDARLHALLVGGGPDHDRLVREVGDLGLQGVCVFTGHVKGLASYYRAMDIQVMPSFTEGMPNVALEGMYMALPLIASRVGGIPEVVVDGETGFLLRSEDEEAFADVMLELAADSEKRQMMGKSGKCRIEAEFSPAVRAERFLQLYEDVLSQ